LASAKEKAARRRLCLVKKPEKTLLDFRFLEIDVFANDGIVFLEGELLGLRPRVLRRHVKEAGVSRGQQLDLDIGGLGHGLSS
jgi:hypothetical protein